MSKVRIYLPRQDFSKEIEITSKEIIHKLKDVLRLRKNEDVYLFDGAGKEFLYKIKNIYRTSILIEKIRLEREESPPHKRVILGLPLLKEEKIEFILQKATELGVYEFILYTSQHSLKGLPSFLKIERWQKIIIEATRQSQRLWLPKIREVFNFKDLLGLSFKVKLLASIDGESLSSILNRDINEVFVLVGPEGDFSSQELLDLKKYNFEFIKLSNNILRVETACIFSVGIINYFLYEN